MLLLAGPLPSSKAPVSLLAVCVLQQALKVASSAKLTSESRICVSAYTAAVLAQLLKTQVDPQPLCRAIIGMFPNHSGVQAQTSAVAGSNLKYVPAAEAVTPATDSRSAALHADHAVHAVDAVHAEQLKLPVEGQPLASLLGCAQRWLWCWQNPGTTPEPKLSQLSQSSLKTSPTLHEPKKSSEKRRKGESSLPAQGSSKRRRGTSDDEFTQVDPAVEYGQASDFCLFLHHKTVSCFEAIGLRPAGLS